MLLKSILVTGGTGLVGKAIEKLSNDYRGVYYIVFVDSKMVDLRDYNETYKFINILKPSVIIHLAACVGGLYKNMENNVKMFEDNILINTNVIKAAHQAGVKELIACLSTCIFPDSKAQTVLLNEDNLHKGEPHYSNEGYAYAKRMLEVQCRLYRENFNKRYFCIIPTNIYGPNDNFNLEDAHVIPALIHKCYLAKQNNEPFVIRGTGSPLRQFIYSMDIAKLIFILLESKFNDNIILSPTEEHSINYVAGVINSYFGNKMIFDSTYSDGQYSKTVDNSKLKSIINFEFTNLKTGIAETIDWFVKNYNSDFIRK